MEILVESSTGTKNEVKAKLIRNAMQREQALLERSLARTEAQLWHFEERYQVSSKDFFQRYQNGEVDDRNDHVDWAGEYQIYLSIREQLDCFAGMKL